MPWAGRFFRLFYILTAAFLAYKFQFMRLFYYQIAPDPAITANISINSHLNL